MFKNVRLFRLENPFALNASALAERLATRQFRPCGPLETTTLGWATPLGDDSTALVTAVNGCLLLCARKQERLLPSSAIAEALDERISELETSEARDVGRAERRRLREQVISEMLPRAFTRSRRTQLYIDTELGWLMVDAASEKQAEDVVTLLRETLESLPARLPNPRQAPSAVMTDWLLADSAPADFMAGDACELRDADDDAGVVRCRGQDLGSEEILNHLRARKLVTKLALNWNERLDFVLADDLSLKRVQVTDALLDELNDDDAKADAAARLEAEFALFALQMRQLIARFETIFGLSDAV
ncbi:recombination-associated protein RdgC [Chromatium okenii]|uniref:Recombination-associated protein RdgC n=1 Tax=Chromatium okenii TaxID=61644 RepID=A0A2S7XN37_9GAMM|nr:recombination-associated protein RdgC [Chromatium okenii]PQJ95145.1 recombination-associated protein RdgC [Chromatium okenii]